MQKWPSCRIAMKILGPPSPKTWEWLMGFPDGWTDFAPLETQSYPQWLRLHGGR